MHRVVLTVGAYTDSSDGEVIDWSQHPASAGRVGRTRGVTPDLTVGIPQQPCCRNLYYARLPMVGYLEQRVTEVVILDGQTTTLDLRLEPGVSLNPVVFSA